MPGTVITVTSGKGGVGKTTTVANLATALALYGQRVVTVDADIGLRNLDIIMGLENHILYDIVDVIEQRCPLGQALVRDERAPVLYLLPAAQARDKSELSHEQIVQLCNELRTMVDFVIIDSPAGIEYGFETAIAPSDRTIIVTTPDVSALRDADKVIYLLERDWQRQPQLILNRFNAQLSDDGEMRNIDDVLDILAIDLLGVVPENNDIVLSTDRGVPAVYDQKNHSATAYLNIAQRILGQNVPLMRFKKQGFFGSLSRIFGG